MDGHYCLSNNSGKFSNHAINVSISGGMHTAYIMAVHLRAFYDLISVEAVSSRSKACNWLVTS